MRKLTLVCAAALLAAPIFAGTSFAQQRPVGHVDVPVAASMGSAAIAGSGIPVAETRLPQASAAAIKAMRFSDTAGGGPVSASSYSDGTRSYPGFSSGIASPMAYGSVGKFPYTTSRAASYDNGVAAPGNDPVTDYPFRATGKLWSRYCVKSANHNIPSPLPCNAADEVYQFFVCTASLIKPGVLVTAAHCVHIYGNQQTGYADYILWYPAAWDSTGAGAQPYGIYRARAWFVLNQYFNGTDTCFQVGVICNNDLAVVVLYNNNNAQPLNDESQAGDLLGTYAYGSNGYSFVVATLLGNRLATQVTQLGYPVGLDLGYKHERTDSLAFYALFGSTKNIIWGSAQTGGSSGGPELVNFGRPPVYGAGQSPGVSNIQAVVGVTSWGYNDINQRILGASWFGTNTEYPGNYAPYGLGNIGFLVQFICTHVTYGPQCT